MRRAAVVLSILLAVSADGQELILAEHGSVGIDPYTKSSWVTRYSSGLEFLTTMLSYPLMSGSPSAALIVDDVLFVGESNCIDSVCAPRLARRELSGGTRNVGPPLTGPTKAIRLSARDELVVVTSAELVRIDRPSGATRARFSLPRGNDSFVTDVDIDASGCGAAVAVFPSAVLLADICGDALAIRRTIAFPGLQGVRAVRFTRENDLLVSSRTLLRFDRDANLIRSYDIAYPDEIAGGCPMEITPDGRSVILACRWYLTRVDLASGVASPAVTIGRGIYADSIAFTVSTGAPRRRHAVAH